MYYFEVYLAQHARNCHKDRCFLSSGKIHVYGTSNINCEQLEKSIFISNNLNLNGYQWVQNSTSLLNYVEAQ